MRQSADSERWKPPAFLSPLLFAALMLAAAWMLFGTLESSIYCLGMGPLAVEPSAAHSVAVLAVIGLPCLALGLLRLKLEEGEDNGGLLTFLSIAFFTPAALMWLLCSMPCMGGPTPFKLFVAVLLIAAAAVVAALLWDQLTCDPRHTWVSREAAEGLYLALGSLCCVLMVFAAPIGLTSAAHSAPAAPVPDGEQAVQAVLSPAGESWAGDGWEGLGADEKLRRLSLIAAAECARLNVDQPPTLEAAWLREGLLGSYESGGNVIVVDLEHMESSDFDQVFNTLCHECAHVFQHACIDNPPIAQDSAWPWPVDASVIVRWISEFGSYVPGREDYQAYASQYSEWSARAWAEREAVAWIPLRA